MAQLQAVIQTGGKQYMVKEGEILRVEKLEATQGSTLNFEPLFIMNEDGTGAKVGAPVVKGAKVVAEVDGVGRHDKVTIIKYHPKTRYKRKAGHRQHFTAIKITSITA